MKKKKKKKPSTEHNGTLPGLWPPSGLVVKYNQPSYNCIFTAILPLNHE